MTKQATAEVLDVLTDAIETNLPEASLAPANPPTGGNGGPEPPSEPDNVGMDPRLQERLRRAMRDPVETWQAIDRLICRGFTFAVIAFATAVYGAATETPWAVLGAVAINAALGASCAAAGFWADRTINTWSELLAEVDKGLHWEINFYLHVATKLQVREGAEALTTLPCVAKFIAGSMRHMQRLAVSIIILTAGVATLTTLSPGLANVDGPLKYSIYAVAALAGLSGLLAIAFARFTLQRFGDMEDTKAILERLIASSRDYARQGEKRFWEMLRQLAPWRRH